MAAPTTSACHEAQSALQASPFYDLRELEVEETSDRRLVIRGLVGSFYHKQLAQELVLTYAKANAYHVVNQVEVVDALTN